MPPTKIFELDFSKDRGGYSRRARESNRESAANGGHKVWEPGEHEGCLYQYDAHFHVKKPKPGAGGSTGGSTGGS